MGIFSNRSKPGSGSTTTSLLDIAQQAAAPSSRGSTSFDDLETRQNGSTTKKSPNSDAFMNALNAYYASLQPAPAPTETADSPAATAPQTPSQTTTPPSNKPPSAAPLAPNAQNSPVTLPEDPVQPDRGQKRPAGGFRSLNGLVAADLMGRNANRGRGTGGFRGSVLSAVYRLPDDNTRAVRSLQSFNGPRGGRTVLGT